MSKRMWLEKGDVIRLEKGMKVNADMPRSVIYENEPYSKEMVHATIEIGVVYRSVPYPKYVLLEKMRNFLLKECGVKISETRLKALIYSLPIDMEVTKLDTSVYEGDYIVTHAEFLGGNPEVITAPYCVYCYKKDNPDINVDFFLNTPYITPNIKEVKKVGHIEQ